MLFIINFGIISIYNFNQNKIKIDNSNKRNSKLIRRLYKPRRQIEICKGGKENGTEKDTFLGG